MIVLQLSVGRCSVGSATAQSKPRRFSGARDATPLLRAFRETGDPAAREQVVELYLPLVRALARRYANRGERLEDLVQVGSVGLIHAVDRFDPDRGTFGAFAVPTICGEIKRHLRDRSSAVRLPRRLDDPRTEFARNPVSLSDRSDGRDVDGVMLVDGAYGACDDRILLAAAFRTLAKRERRILHLRFYAGLSQAEIARELGLSQIQVSRLIRTSLERLRGAIGETRSTTRSRQTSQSL